MYDKKETIYILSEDVLLYELDASKSNNYGTKIDVSDLNDGDVIYFCTNQKNEINIVQRAVNVENLDQYYTNSSFLDEWGIRKGKIYSVKSDVARIAFSDDDLKNEKNLQVWSLSKFTPLYIFDTTERTLRLGTTSDIIPYKFCNTVNGASFIFLRARYGTPMEAIIYN